MSSDTPSGCTASCGSAVDAGLFLCRSHSQTLLDVLRGVPALVTDLEVTITRQNRTVSERHGARSSTTPLPWNEHAAVAASDLAAALNAASMTVARREQHPDDRLEHVAAYDTANLARWLARNLDTLRRLPEAGDVFAVVDDAIRVARRATDRPPERSPLGRCGAEIDEAGSECGEHIYVAQGASQARCRCGAVHDVAQRRDWMLRHCRGLRGTASEVASWLRMFDVTTSAEAVRSMARRGRLSEVPASGDVPRYRLVDAVTAYSRSRSRRGDAVRSA